MTSGADERIDDAGRVEARMGERGEQQERQEDE